MGEALPVEPAHAPVQLKLPGHDCLMVLGGTRAQRRTIAIAERPALEQHQQLAAQDDPLKGTCTAARLQCGKARRLMRQTLPCRMLYGRQHKAQLEGRNMCMGPAARRRFQSGLRSTGSCLRRMIPCRALKTAAILQ